MEYTEVIIMKTALYERHCALNAKIIEFCGWEMPGLYAKGSRHEHMAVREKVGIFDVSHMGRVLVTGKEAEVFLDYLSTNCIAGKKDKTATYTVWASEDGFSIDDVIIYRIDAESFFLIVNAGNRDKDLKHMRKEAANFDVTIKDKFASEGILAIQGPHAKELLQGILPSVEELKFMRFEHIPYQGKEVILSRTGYTGSTGYEVYADNDLIVSLWDACVAGGAEPIGLVARDTLRLEVGFALYGHELSDSIAATESVSAWTVKFEKEAFLGKEALLERKGASKKRYQYALSLVDKGIPRQDYEVFKDNALIGTVTSGTFSPCLEQGIAIALVDIPLEEGDRVEIQIRKNKVAAEVTKLPFWSEKKKIDKVKVGVK
jgi:aminomethyltransferase